MLRMVHISEAGLVDAAARRRTDVPKPTSTGRFRGVRPPALRLLAIEMSLSGGYQPR
jgi:hypothetical protein